MGMRAGVAHFYSDDTIEMGYTCSHSHDEKQPSLSTGSSGENVKRTIYRAKSNVRRLVMAMGGKAMLTLTYRENQTDYNLAKKHFSSFVARCRRKYGKFPYVAVPETQKRGAWHGHAVLDSYYPANEIRTLWGHGNIDLQKIHDRKRAARYITKYLAKTFNSKWPANEPRYLRSRNIKQNVQTLHFANTHEALDYFHRLTEGIHAYHWEQDGNGFITT